MTLEKVVEILELNLKALGNKMPKDTFDALCIAVEAVKDVKRQRATDRSFVIKKLPGETRL